MISYTDAVMEQERNDPKWLCANSGDKVDDNLFVDTIDINDRSITTAMLSCDVNWFYIGRYRLHNGPGYKDGIAIDEQLPETMFDNSHYRELRRMQAAKEEQAGCKITQRKEHGPSTKDRLLALINDDEAMQAIALEACLEQQKVIDKAIVLERATTALGYNCHPRDCELYDVLVTLYDLDLLTTNGESND